MSRSRCFTGELYQTFFFFKLPPIFHKLFQKVSEEEMLLNTFYKASITLIPKPDKDITEKITYQYH